MSKYGVFPGPYFPIFGLNTGKYGPEKTPYLDTFHATSTYITKRWISSEFSVLTLEDLIKKDYQYNSMIFDKKDTSQHDCVPPNQILQMKFLEITFS